MHSLIASVAVSAAMLIPTTAAQAGPTACSKAYSVRAAVVKQFGKRAPGRNICRYGVKHSNGKVVDATFEQKKRYLRQLRKLVSPPAYLAARAAPPAQHPAGTMSTAYKPSGLASCIVAHESGGNPQASNGSHWGIAQWTIEAWLRHGGGRFSPTPLGASYQEQLQVLSDGLSKYGCRDWCPFDGC